MAKYAMVNKKNVIDVINSDYVPKYPPTSDGTEVTAVECDETVEIGMIYDSDTGEFYYLEPLPVPEPEPKQPTNQEIMDKLNEMTNGMVSTTELDAAYREGVNAYV